jgi:ribosomal protein L24E
VLRKFCGHLISPGDETVTLNADGKPVETSAS